jgi:hypothetical protein
MHANGARRLSDSFVPGHYDVLCARGKKARNSEGNRRFRALVQLHQEKYNAATCKVEKSTIVSHIVDTVRHASPQGGFVKFVEGAYWEVGDRAAKERVGQTFRDFLPTKYASSTKAKAQAREEKMTRTISTLISLSQQSQRRYPDREDSHGATSNHSPDDHSVENTSEMPFIKDISVPDNFDECSLAFHTTEVLEALRSSIHTIGSGSLSGSIAESLSSSSRGSIASSFRGSRGQDLQPRSAYFHLDSFVEAPPAYIGNAYRDSVESSLSPVSFRRHASTADTKIMASPRWSLVDTMVMENLSLAGKLTFDFSMDLDEEPMDEDLKNFYESVGVSA